MAKRAHTRKAAKKGKKSTRKQSPWLKHVMKTFHAMKAKDKNVRFTDALKQAAKTKNQM